MNFDSDQILLKLVGKRIKKARYKASLSQEELASKLGLSQQLVSHYERGCRPIKIDLLQSIAIICEVPFNYFFTESDEYLEGCLVLRKLNPQNRSIALTQLKAFPEAHGM